MAIRLLPRSFRAPFGRPTAKVTHCMLHPLAAVRPRERRSFAAALCALLCSRASRSGGLPNVWSGGFSSGTDGGVSGSWFEVTAP